MAPDTAHVALADSFIEALAGLDAGDAKRAASFVAKLVEDPARAGFDFEIVHDARDRAVRSARVTRDLRAIAHVEDGRVPTPNAALPSTVAAPPGAPVFDECTWTTPAAKRWICTVTDGRSLCELLDDRSVVHDLAQ